MGDLSAVTLRILGPRATLLGADDALENIVTDILPDGALCWVTEAEAPYRLHKTSTVAANGTTIIEPSAGPGRWIRESGGSDPDSNFEEVTVDTVSGETLVPISVEMEADSVFTAGVRWLGRDASNNVLIHETTFVYKRTGGGAATEVGAHDNGDIRDLSQIAGAPDSDYVTTATGVSLTVTGSVGIPITWTVQIWYTPFVIP
jgi:hypothetical protein